MQNRYLVKVSDSQRLYSPNGMGDVIPVETSARSACEDKEEPECVKTW